MDETVRYYNKKADENRKTFIEGAKWQASQHEWVSVKDRLPTRKDAVDGLVEVIDVSPYSNKHSTIQKRPISKVKLYGYWRTPLPNNFPPPKTEI